MPLRFHQDYRFVNFGYGRLPDEGGNPVWRHHPYELWLRKGDDPRNANGGAGVLAMTIGVWAYCVERRRHAARFVAVAAGGGLQGAGAAAPAAHQSASVRMDEHGNWVSKVTTDDGQSFVIR